MLELLSTDSVNAKDRVSIRGIVKMPDGSDTSVMTFTTSITAGIVLCHTDATGSANSAFPYRACVYDNGSTLVTSTIIENVLSQHEAVRKESRVIALN